MRIMVLGADGYIGWPLWHFLASRGHEVCAIDSLVKRHWRVKLKIGAFGRSAEEKTPYVLMVGERGQLWDALNHFQPEAIIHLAEQPSAPLSMGSLELARVTQLQNIDSTLTLMWDVRRFSELKGWMPHIIKLGSMGEYGTPNIPIEEGWLEVEHKGHRDRVLYPKKPGSFYHASKVADSVNLEFGCRAWGLRVTDLNQGVVWGTGTEECPFEDPARATFWHYDELFGTVVNRFVAQAAVGSTLSVYGGGRQQRGFIHLQDSLRCIEIAALNPAREGEFRVFNQLSETLSIREVSNKFPNVNRYIENPRVEDEEHLYRVAYSALPKLGFDNPRKLTCRAADDMVSQLQQSPDLGSHKAAITCAPEVKWRP